MGYNTCETCGETVSGGVCDNCESESTYFGSKFGESYNKYSHTREFNHEERED
jgi:hypothetical protein